MMKFTKIKFGDVCAEESYFSVEEGVTESHFILHALPNSTFDYQLNSILSAFIKIKEDRKKSTLLFVRVFLSDIVNQKKFVEDYISKCGLKCVVSYIQQAPLDESKIALWCYFADGFVSKEKCGLNIFSHNDYEYIWSTEKGEFGNSYMQSVSLLNKTRNNLEKLNLNLKDNCVRTWFYVQNIDVNYKGIVQGRNDVFSEEDLTKETHFIASTGIEGRSEEPESIVRLDTYCIGNISQKQIHYLYAKTHLNPTHEYGVAFERGTAIHYADRKHIFISGTASIDNKGNILYLGDIEKQTKRMWENVEVLLAEAKATKEDFAQIVVYLRDISDYFIVKNLFDEHFPNSPKVIVQAPVCRPGWLIEMEGIAIVKNKEEEYRSF